MNSENKATGAQNAATESESNVTPITTPPAEEKATGGDVGVYTHTFTTPYEYEGKKYDEIAFNFNRLTGRDMLSIEADMQAQNEYALAPEISRAFQCRMAARAAGIGADVIEGMSMKDFNRITNAARDFLISTGY